VGSTAGDVEARASPPQSLASGNRWPAGHPSQDATGEGPGRERARACVVERECDRDRVTAWRDFEDAAPEFAGRVRALFDAGRHKTPATLRADGSPRISGIETVFTDGELAFGSMSNTRKGADLLRDPRFALHSATIDPAEGAAAQWPGEAKISGRAGPVGPIAEGPDGVRFGVELTAGVRTHLNEAATLLVVEWWTPTHGLRRIDRE
jgi:hypothetical protein